MNLVQKILVWMGFGALLLCVQFSFADQGYIRIPCGIGFLRACFEGERQIASLSRKSEGTGIHERAVIPKLNKNVIEYIKSYVAFLYNEGEDAHHQKITFPEGGKAVDPSTGDSQNYGKDVCSRCRTTYNDFLPEKRVNHYNKACGKTTTTVRVFGNGQTYVQPGEDSVAWYNGILPMIINRKMNETLSHIKQSRSIAYTPGCRSMALTIERLTGESKDLTDKMASLMGNEKDKFKEVFMSEKDFDDFLSEPNEKTQNSPLLSQQEANKRPDQGKLRQLAQKIRAVVLNLEASASYLAICTIQEQAGVEFRKRFGTWREFLSEQAVDVINSRVQAQASQECGSCKSMGVCLDCVNNVANRVAPLEVENYFDQRLAPYCDDQTTREFSFLTHF